MLYTRTTTYCTCNYTHTLAHIYVWVISLFMGIYSAKLRVKFLLITWLSPMLASRARMGQSQLRASPCHLFSDNMSECTYNMYSTALLLSGFVNPNFADIHITPIMCTSDCYLFWKSYNCDIRSILKYKIWQTEELPNCSNLNTNMYTYVLPTY
jgi:hypothetical protein